MQRIKHYVLPLIDFTEINREFRNIEDRIIASVVKTTGVSWDRIKEKNRRKEVKDARHLYNYMMRKNTNRTLKYIGETTGRDHASVLHSCKVIKNYLDTDDDFIECIKLVNYYISIYGYKPQETTSATL